MASKRTHIWEKTRNKAARWQSFTAQILEDGTFVRKAKEFYEVCAYGCSFMYITTDLYCQMRDCDEYSYAPLPGKSYVRLLKIESGSTTDVLRCSLETVDMAESPKFTALSYCWYSDSSLAYLFALYSTIFPLYWKMIMKRGHFTRHGKFETDAEDTWRDCVQIIEGLKLSYHRKTMNFTKNQKVLCNGKVIEIQPNLYDALLHLRTLTPAAYWIDALCINQEDVNERNDQVRMMSQIYSDAERVLIWLGLVPFLLHPGMKKLLAMVEQLKQDLSTLNILTCLEKAVDEESDAGEEIFAAAAFLLTRRYFRRIWVIQEYCLAKEATFIFGDYQFTDRVLKTLVGFLFAFEEGEQGLKIRATAALIPLCDTMVRSLPKVLESRDQLKRGIRLTLPEWLVIIKGRKATDTKDALFAGLSLVRFEDLSINKGLQQRTTQASDAVPHSEGPISEQNRLWSSLHVDYNADVSDVLVNVAACIVTHYGWEELFYHVIRFRQPPTPIDSEHMPLFISPSWVPDPSVWSTRVFEPFFMRNNKKLPLSGHGEASPEISSDGKTLQMTVAHFGTVSNSCHMHGLVGLVDGEYSERILRTLEWLALDVPRRLQSPDILGIEAVVLVATSAFRLQREGANKAHREALLSRFAQLIHINVQRNVSRLKSDALFTRTKYNSRKVRKERIMEVFGDVKKKHPDISWPATPIKDSHSVEDTEVDLVMYPPVEREEITLRKSSLTELHDTLEETVKDPDYRLQAHFMPGMSATMSFFMTNTGYMGIGSNWLQKGDSVLLIPGGHACYIFTPLDTVLKRRAEELREELKEHKPSSPGKTTLEFELKSVEGRIGKHEAYQLVGEAYIEGVMNGEVAEEFADKLRTYNIM